MSVPSKWLGPALALLAVGWARAGEAPDAFITTKAKIALLTADDVSVTAVNVDSVGGSVTLHGKVKTAGEKERATATVRSIDGVKKVQNLLQVVPDAFTSSVEVADSSIRDGVAASLKAPGLRAVRVTSVNKGVVLLSGKTATLGDTLSAIEKAYKVPGMRRVASEIQTSATPY